MGAPLKRLPPIESQFIEVKLLHHNKYSDVYLCRHIFTYEDVIIEKFEYGNSPSVELMSYIAHETMNRIILSSVPTMHRTLDVIKKPTFTWYISENAQNETFESLITGNPIPPQQAKYLFFLLASTLQILHGHLLSVNDWRPHNFLFCYTMIKFMNYQGLVPLKKLNNVKEIAYIGDPTWMAPEALIADEYELEKADIWGLGLYLYLLLTGNALFSNPVDIFKQIKSPDFKINLLNNDAISKDAYDLLTNILCLDPSKRISIHEILNHKFLMPSVPFPIYHLPIEETPEINEWAQFLKLDRKSIIEKLKSYSTDDSTLLFMLSYSAIGKGRTPKDIQPPTPPNMDEILINYTAYPKEIQINIDPFNLSKPDENKELICELKKKAKQMKSNSLHKLLKVCADGLENKGIKVEHLSTYLNSDPTKNEK